MKLLNFSKQYLTHSLLNGLWFILLTLCSAVRVNAQSVSARNADSLNLLLKNHREHDTIWIELHYNLMAANISLGRYRENLVLAERSLLVADSLHFDRGRVRIFKALARSLGYLGKMEDSIIYVNNLALEIAKKNKFMTDWVDLLNTNATCYYLKDDYINSLSNNFEAIKIAKEINYKRGIGLANLQIGNVYYGKFSDYNTALKYYLEALEYTTLNVRCVALVNVGIIFSELKDFNKANEYYTRALKESLAFGEKHIEVGAMNYKGSLFLEWKKYDSAHFFFAEGLAMAKKHGLRHDEAQSDIGMARVYTSWKDYKNAMTHFENAERILQETNFTRELIRIYYYIALLNRDMGMMKEQRKYLMKALKMQPSRDKDSYKKILIELVDLMKKENDFKSALSYQQQISALQDSVFNEQKIREAMRMEANFHIELSQREVEVLETKNLLNESRMAGHDITRKTMIAFLFVLLLAVGFMFKAYCTKRKANQKLQEKNLIIESQKEELRSSLEHIQKVQKQLIHSEKMASLGQMTAGIAHEINNPLNFISGGVEGLMETMKDVMSYLKKPSSIDKKKVNEIESEMIALFQALQNGVERVSKTIISLRSFSSSQVSEMILVSIKDVVEISLTLLCSKITSHQIDVTCHYDPHLRQVSVNPTEMNQVFVNILDNAIQAMETTDGKRALHVEVKQKENFVEVTINDNGIGIPENIQSRIMEPFFTSKPAGKGTGLGLSVSYGIVEKYRGSISFVSEEGKGSSFTVLIPSV